VAEVGGDDEEIAGVLQIRGEEGAERSLLLLTNIEVAFLKKVYKDTEALKR
jgi:hypothetical protein